MRYIGLSNMTWWFFRNLAAYILMVITFPIFLIVIYIYSIFRNLKVVFTPDGSEVIRWPWELERD